jgi:hypothetical protein
MKLDHECVIYVMELVSGFVGQPAECHLLKIFCVDIDYHR